MIDLDVWERMRETINKQSKVIRQLVKKIQDQDQRLDNLEKIEVTRGKTADIFGNIWNKK
jgi:hypothetical protein